MNKFVMMLVTLMVTLFSVNTLAFTPPPAPAKGWYVVDQAGKLSESQKKQLNLKIEQVNRTTANEFGVLLLPDMGGDNIEDVAHSTFKAWGVGKKDLDNGCLIVVAIKERKSRIETGKGVEGDVPDLRANDILKKNLNPHLKNGDFYGGLDETLSALSSQIESRRAERDAIKNKQTAGTQPMQPVYKDSGNGGCAVGPAGTDTGSSLFAVLVVLGAIGLGVWLVSQHFKRKAKRELAAEKARKQRIISAKKKLQDEFDAAQKEREQVLSLQTPRGKVPSVPPTVPSVVTRHKPVSKTYPTTVVTPTTAVVVGNAAALLRKEREETTRKQVEERRAKQLDEDRKRRKREEDSRSSYSSSSSYDSGSSSSSYDSGGSGFGGGDSGGGGSSSDW